MARMLDMDGDYPGFEPGQTETITELDPRYIAALEKFRQEKFQMPSYASEQIGIYDRAARQLDQEKSRIALAIADELGTGEKRAPTEVTKPQLDISGDFYPRDVLVNKLNGKEDREAKVQAEAMLKVCLADDEVKKSLSADGLTPNTIDDLKEALERKTVSYETVVNMLRAHRKSFLAEAALMEEHFERWKGEVKTRVLQEIETGYLPAHLADRIDERLGELRVEYTDFLESPRIADHKLWHIRISSGMPMAKRRHAFFHEAIHAIMGRELAIAYGQQGPRNRFGRLVIKRSGLDQATYGLGGTPTRNQHTGINEAVTEEVAKRLSGYEGDEGYQFERLEMRGFIMRGELTERDLILAAAEDTHVQDEERPEWNRLIQKVSAERLATI